MTHDRTNAALLDVPSAPESVLDPAVLDRLPATSPPAPWDCRLRAVVWVQRGAPELTGPLAGRLRPVTIGAVIEYLDSPVGPYREVFAAPVVRGRLAVHVPFMAVDSPASLRGGRENWGLPKVLASFHGDVADGRASATGDGWSVAVEASATSVALPFAVGFGNLQAAGRARVALRGRGRPARVHVRAQGPSLSTWLGSGTHAGLVGEGRMRMHPTRG